MTFDSFEQALKVCMTAEEGSAEQDAALIYCLENAPPELQAVMKEQYRKFHEHKHQCDCGCKK